MYIQHKPAGSLLQNVHDYDTAIEAIVQGEETIPSEVIYATLYGANPIRVWREYRGLTQQQLSGVEGISKPYLSQI